MSNAVTSQAAVKDSDLAEKESSSHAVPTAVVLPVDKDLLGRVLWCEDKNGNEDDDEPNAVHDQTANLQSREEGRSPGVEEDGDQVERPHEQGVLPAGASKVRLVDLHDSLDLRRQNLSASSGTSEPSEGGHPSGKVREEPLPFRR